MLGDSTRNKYCIFCACWFNPGERGLKMRNGSGGKLFDIDNKLRCSCRVTGLKTPACSTCPAFKRKY